jgi:hypothetical protein
MMIGFLTQWGTAMAPRFSAVCTLAVVGMLAFMCSRASAGDETGAEGRGIYVGLFGGVSGNSIQNVGQVGTALFPDMSGGPLNVNALGGTGTRAFGIVGLHIGHEWSGGCDEPGGWHMLPAVEVEGFYMGGTQKSNAFNPVPRLPEHNFLVTLPMDNAVILTNVVVSLQDDCTGIAPYIGAGFGATSINISGADSLQLGPPEMGVNHFNSNPNSSNWGFAAQGKAGVRVPLTDHLYVFGEYRFLYVSGTTFTFGSTVSPGHVATTPWTVHLGDMFNHMVVGGVGINF